MKVDDHDSFENKYRLRGGNQIIYPIISPGTFNRDALPFPLRSLPCLSYSEELTVAHISRDGIHGGLKTSFSDRTLAGIKFRWHHTQVDCLEMGTARQPTAMTFEAVSYSTLASSTTIIANITRFV